MKWYASAAKLKRNHFLLTDTPKQFHRRFPCKKRDLIEPAGFGKTELVCICDKQLNYFVFFVPYELP